MSKLIFKPEYRKSWALIIGINNYLNVSPLGYARNDAEAIANILEKKFDFKKENITLLLDKEATKKKIMSSFLKFAQENVKPNDRVLVFFAGHGHTITGNRGEVGFLIPVDGDINDISTFIRWDDLTKNTELINAKHIFFIMDACYGGLAITRSLQPGSMRFLKDMLQRNSRQVLTAGKADEQVADSGGPLPDHSIFTGHLLKALDGEAESKDGVITANNVMSYVYKKVSTDLYSKQTPHFGFLEGDGDFIFKASILDSLQKEEKKDEDILIEIPALLNEKNPNEEELNIIEKTKEYLSSDRYRIKLEDLTIGEIRKVLTFLKEDHFSSKKNVNSEEFINRLKKYESIIHPLQTITISLAYWGNNNHSSLLKKIITRIAENQKTREGKTAWLALRWYPTIILLYSAGISAIAADNYNYLSKILLTKITRHNKNDSEITLIVGEAIKDIARSNLFKTLPEYEQKYVPRSEYTFKLLQPLFDDLLFLGKEYEKMFDRFEVFLALVYADLNNQNGYIWGPIGRFGWKFNNLSGNNNIFIDIKKEAESLKNEWPPIKNGFFGGSYDRFAKICQGFEEKLQKLNWY